MASENQTDLAAALRSVTLKIAEVLSNPRMSYTLPGGASVDFKGYYESLLSYQKALREALLLEQGPFEVTSVAR